MFILESDDDFHEGDSVRVVYVDHLPERFASEKLGTRRQGAIGIVIKASVPGFDSGAIRVKLLEPFGEQNGEEGVYFSGECERIPDLVPRP
jgi:hypothetical protein